MLLLNDMYNTLQHTLTEDLDFQGADTRYAPHGLHAFPAKFPPQLPQLFINRLTTLGDCVLDPMAGSGTTMVETYFAGRQAVGFDIDPLALLLIQVKTTPLDSKLAFETGNQILKQAREMTTHQSDVLYEQIASEHDTPTQQFIDYWFAKQTQLRLQALWAGIRTIDHKPLRDFLSLVFSGIIITRSGGVSLAFDLAHSRPHRAKIVKTAAGELLIGEDLVGNGKPRVQLLTKTLRDPLEDFGKALSQNVMSLPTSSPDRIDPDIRMADAQSMPLRSNTVDLIVTSPPYAANAIDYMRAHKFSLVWMGYSVLELRNRRKAYIGGEAISEVTFESLPEKPMQVVRAIEQHDPKRAQVIHRYYSEMKRSLREMYRVLKPGKAAVLVVATSVIRGIDIEISSCLVAIGQSIGFELVGISRRNIDPNRRMLPVGNGHRSTGRIPATNA